MDLKDFINKNYTYAVVGASNDKDKYGNKVFLDLKEAGYKVIPISLHEEEIEGTKAYKSLKEAHSIDVVVTLVPPKVTEKVLEKVLRKGIKKVWMQPGSESKKAINYCKENNIDYNENPSEIMPCIMIVRRQNA